MGGLFGHQKENKTSVARYLGHTLGTPRSPIIPILLTTGYSCYRAIKTHRENVHIRHPLEVIASYHSLAVSD